MPGGVTAPGKNIIIVAYEILCQDGTNCRVDAAGKDGNSPNLGVQAPSGPAGTAGSINGQGGTDGEFLFCQSPACLEPCALVASLGT